MLLRMRENPRSMIVLRYAAGSFSLAAALAAGLVRDGVLLATSGVAALAIRPFAFHGRATWLSLLPIGAFAAGLALLDLASNGVPSSLAVRTVVVFLWLTAGSRLMPWTDLLGRACGSMFWTPALFVLVTRHFVQVLSGETVRVFRARSLQVPRRFGPGAFRALAWALVAVVLRSWGRAERFYAAQRLRGLAG